MASFLRPGTKSASAFGVSFDTDRGDRASAAPIYNPNERHALSEQRRLLPIYKHRREILYLIEHHATTVVVGETGSGKTTQIPQYLYETGWASTSSSGGGGGGMIACTQPRRVAAMTVAARVAEEVGCRLGQEVGYAIRFEDVSTAGVTKIKFCTDGVLLREMMDDPLLTKYSVIMIDEAHERSLATDVLLGLLKKVQRKRPSLRLIISSATMEAERMAHFFSPKSSSSTINKNNNEDKEGSDQVVNKTPALISVEGRTHHVQVHYSNDPVSDYVLSAVETAISIHKEDLPGDILIFMPGQDDCERAVGLLLDEDRVLARLTSTSVSGGGSQLKLRLQPCALYAGLPGSYQLAALQPPARGKRKVVVATNIAETSVTIEGVVYVIDSMFAKQRCFNPLTGFESLLVAPISKASASQRAGRAGRVRPGHCLRLCTEESFDELPNVTIPEMQRSDLSGVVLQLKALGIDNMMHFEWLAPPPSEAMIKALESLHALGALGDDAKLTTPIGEHMADLPIDPVLSRALLASIQLECTAEVSTIVAMLSVQSVWAPGREKKAFQEARSRFAVAEGDLLTYLNVWRGWEGSGRSKKWSFENFVSHRAMLRAADIRSQIAAHLRRLGLPLKSYLDQFTYDSKTGKAALGSRDLTPVKKALTTGLFINAAKLTEELHVKLSDAEDAGTGTYRLVRSPGGEAAQAKLRIHPSSVLFRCRPQWVCFYSAQQSDTGWYEMQEMLAIEPEWLMEVAPHMYEMKKVNPAMRM